MSDTTSDPASTLEERIERVGGIDVFLDAMPQEYRVELGKLYSDITDIKNALDNFDLDAGPDPSLVGDLTKVDINGWNALHHACWDGRESDVVDLFKDAAAALQVEDEDGETPFHLACIRGHVSIVEYLISEARDLMPDLITYYTLASVIIAPHLDVLNLIVPLAKPEVFLETDEKGRSLLHYAHKSRNQEVVELIRQHAPKREELDSSGELTPRDT